LSSYNGIIIAKVRLKPLIIIQRRPYIQVNLNLYVVYDSFLKSYSLISASKWKE